MSLAILGLFKALSPLFPATPRRFVPAGVSAPVIGARLASPHPVMAARPVHRPLRVTRLLDQDVGTASAGRMVMFGRFADVCAELDRLAELESAREAARTHH
jgi:hypothetical protein